VLGEKPISNDLTSARNGGFGQRKSLRYGINQNHRFTPAGASANNGFKKSRLGS
jgi:hypothetical protein